jgi:cobalt-zinc-cadmium efflux system membrane fusion protein
MRLQQIHTIVWRLAAPAAVAMAVLVALGQAWAHEDHAPLPTKGVTIAGNNVLLSDKARKAIGLTTVKVTLGDLHRTVEVNAKVELPWNQQAMIASLVPGKIDQVFVKPGEKVAAGQELAHIASVELESLQLTLLQAATQLDLAERLVEQRKALDQQGVIAGKDLLEAQSSLAEKTAALRIAEQKLRALGLEEAVLEKIRHTGKPVPLIPITSPISGVISHADVRVGQVVELTDHLYHVVDPSRVWIVGEVLESDVRHLESGQKVAARFAAYPEKVFEGEIDHVRLKMDRRRRTQSVVILVNNGEGFLRPGMFGHVSIAVQVAEQAIVCPADAILKSRSGKYVLVQRSPGKYENRPVKLGLEKGDQVEVLSGVFPGDKVVVIGAYLLASLLGNEHKARVRGSRKTEEKQQVKTSQRSIAVASATVELPTNQQAFATPRIGGRIRRVLVQPSQHVRTGDTLVEVESLELRTVQLDLLQTLARLRLTEQSLNRLAELAEKGTMPQRRMWELQNEQQGLKNTVASLKRQLAFFGLSEEQIRELENADLSDSKTILPLLETVPIRAPLDGWIVGFNAVPGQVVHAHDQLFEIHDLSKVWVKGYVFEPDVARLAIGQSAHVTFAAFPGLEAIGRAVRIAPMMSEGERVLPVWVEVDNADQVLKEGMLARVTLLARSETPGGSSSAAAQLRRVRVIR